MEESHASSQSLGRIIDIHLKTTGQLFNTLDPSPFHERELDEAAKHMESVSRQFKEWARAAR